MNKDRGSPSFKKRTPSSQTRAKHETAVFIALVAFVSRVLAGIGYMVFRKVHTPKEAMRREISSLVRDPSGSFGPEVEKAGVLKALKVRVAMMIVS